MGFNSVEPYEEAAQSLPAAGRQGRGRVKMTE